MTRLCGDNGEWQAVEFGSCSCPEEPGWPSTPSNAYAHQPCPPSYQGSVSRRCNRLGEWGNVFWDCRSLVCPEEQLGELVFSETAAGTRVEVDCPSPFWGTMTRLCDAQGKWQDVEDHCRMQSCEAFRFSLDSANSLFVFYKGNQTCSQLSMNIFAAENRSYSVQGTRIHSDPLQPFIPHLIRIYAWDHSTLLDACFIPNVVVSATCAEIDQPFVASIESSNRFTFGIVFPHCGTLSPASFVFSLTAERSDVCPMSFQWSEEFSCEETADCASREIARITIPRSLLPQCTYKVSYALSLDKSTLLPLESPVLTFQPASLCTEFTFDISTTLVSIDFVAVSWFASRPLVFRKILLRLGVATSRQLTSVDVSDLRVHAVCSSVASCYHLSTITVPIPKRDCWILVNVQAETEDACNPLLDVSSAFYAFSSIVTRVEVLPEDSYLRVNVLQLSVTASIDITVYNVLGEELRHVTHPLFFRNLTSLFVGGLHPNSRYRVAWTITDHSQFSVQNQTQVITKPFHPPDLQLRILSVGTSSILVRFWSSVTAQVRCQFASSDASPPSLHPYEAWKVRVAGWRRALARHAGG